MRRANEERKESKLTGSGAAKCVAKRNKQQKGMSEGEGESD